jgi:hypothetical protein
MIKLLNLNQDLPNKFAIIPTAVSPYPLLNYAYQLEKENLLDTKLTEHLYSIHLAVIYDSLMFSLHPDNVMQQELRKPTVTATYLELPVTTIANDKYDYVPVKNIYTLLIKTKPFAAITHMWLHEKLLKP